MRGPPFGGLFRAQNRAVERAFFSARVCTKVWRSSAYGDKNEPLGTYKHISITNAQLTMARGDIAIT
jgi:hypothetical protein